MNRPNTVLLVITLLAGACLGVCLTSETKAQGWTPPEYEKNYNVKYEDARVTYSFVVRAKGIGKAWSKAIKILEGMKIEKRHRATGHVYIAEQ